MIEKIKELRVEIDSVTQLMDQAFITPSDKHIGGSRYTSLAFTGLEKF